MQRETSVSDGHDYQDCWWHFSDVNRWIDGWTHRCEEEHHTGEGEATGVT